VDLDLMHIASRTLVLVAAFSLIACHTARAQERPFQFTVTAPTNAEPQAATVEYGVGVGRHDFVSGVERGVEQQVNLQADLTHGLRFVGGFAVALDEAPNGTSSSAYAELLVNVLHANSGRSNLAVGGGILHEYTGTDVLRGRIAAGHDFAMSRLHANVLFEKPLGTATTTGTTTGTTTRRDSLDLITSVGWLVQATRTLHVGVEAIGEDLEGFWEAEEAEGGARLLIGPSLYVQPPGKHWRLGISGGPVIRATRSDLQSGAPRDLPQGGFAIRTSLGYLF
jgi:hypothetical protein